MTNYQQQHEDHQPDPVRVYPFTATLPARGTCVCDRPLVWSPEATRIVNGEEWQGDWTHADMIDPTTIQPTGSQWAQFYEEDPATGQAVFSPERLAEWQQRQAERLCGGAA